MPIKFCTSLELDIVYARWWGRMDAQTRRQNIENYLDDQHYRPGRPELVDLAGITETDFNLKNAQILLHQIKSDGPPKDVSTHRVIFAPGDVPYGCARMFQSLAEATHKGHIEVFRNEGRALASLMLPYATIADMLQAKPFLPQERRNPERLEATGNSL